MDILYYVGIDISKATLDWAVHNGKTIVFQTNTPNTVAGIKAALRLLKTLPAWQAQQTVFCMEHTAAADRRHLQCSSARFSSQSSFFHLVRKQFTD